MADHRLPLESGPVEALARELAAQLGIGGRGRLEEWPEDVRQWISAAARDLRQHRSAGLVVVGDQQSAAAHALAHRINDALGNVGQTIEYTASAEASPVNQLHSLRELSEAICAGAVDTLLILGGNPVYTAPADLEIGMRLAQIKTTIHLSLYFNETSARCAWHLPETHFLEAWSDIRAFDGTTTILQPLIAPIYGGKSPHELLEWLVRPESSRSDYETVREFWRAQMTWPDFEKGWRTALHDGCMAGTALPIKQVHLSSEFRNREYDIGAEPAVLARHATLRGEMPPSEAGLETGETRAGELGAPVEIIFRPDPHLWDGRFGNNAWLRELPKPLTKLAWDNAALVSPALASEAGLVNGDVVRIRCGQRNIEAPVWVTPGQARRSVTLPLGYGQQTGRVARGVGFNSYALRTSNSFWSGTGARLTKVGRRYALVSTQTHQNVEGEDRQIYRTITWQTFRENPRLTGTSAPAADMTLYNPGEFKSEDSQWAMSIDLSACIGCNACVVACAAENNIPVVGKSQVALGREMFWLRIDTYHDGGRDNPRFHHQPVPCMHCENAPCELVCPVEATLHDHEGLNVQVYNRCVGTRYCSNNCPYKVRRFNFLHYSSAAAREREPMQNPEVTVRWRGVMEKCTYCVQRISAARIKAKEESRPIHDGEVQTACQQACPAQAIVFGDLRDPASAVSKLKRHPLDFAMLGSLNTRPRTTYLAKVQNLNPEFNAPPGHTSRSS